MSLVRFRLWAFVLHFGTSNLIGYGALAQSVEHLTFNQVVRGSNPRCFIGGDAKSLEKSRFLASFFFVKNGKFGYLLVTQILGTFFAPKYLWHPLDLHHHNSYSLQLVVSYQRVMKPEPYFRLLHLQHL